PSSAPRSSERLQMTTNSIAHIAVYFLVILALTKPLGAYMAAVFTGDGRLSRRFLAPVERVIFRLFMVDPTHEMDWKRYAVAVLLFSAVGMIPVFAVMRLQGHLPLNPQSLPAASPHLSFNTAASFDSNTNWQSYGGESTLSYLSQMIGLT